MSASFLVVNGCIRNQCTVQICEKRYIKMNNNNNKQQKLMKSIHSTSKKFVLVSSVSPGTYSGV